MPDCVRDLKTYIYVQMSIHTQTHLYEVVSFCYFNPRWRKNSRILSSRLWRYAACMKLMEISRNIYHLHRRSRTRRDFSKFQQITRCHISDDRILGGQRRDYLMSQGKKYWEPFCYRVNMATCQTGLFSQTTPQIRSLYSDYAFASGEL